MVDPEAGSGRMDGLGGVWANLNKDGLYKLKNQVESVVRIGNYSAERVGQLLQF